MLQPSNLKNPKSLNLNSLFASINYSGTYTQLPRRLGHIGHEMLARTLKAVDGLTLIGKKPVCLCEACQLGKATRQKVSGANRHKPELLEVIESDSQGPFPIRAHDGTNCNIKFIDSRSGYLKMETLKDLTAATARAIFEPWLNRMETRTGRRIKNLRVDGADCYYKSFFQYLKQKGITKQTGMPHYHTHPGKAERVHRTVMSFARAMLLASKLPVIFYNEAQLTAAYLHNRTVHGADSITPYEHIYGYRPNLAHLKPFGCVAYAYIPLENRNKLADTSERCRLLGYLDDDANDERQGYKLLRESDGAIVFSRDVVFDEAAILSHLPDQIAFDDVSHGDDLFGDPTYTPTEDGKDTYDDSDDDFDGDSDFPTPKSRPKRGIVASASETDNP